jgi:outer membrane protein OmpA-like peptidoglycan-associated protein
MTVSCHAGHISIPVTSSQSLAVPPAAISEAPPKTFAAPPTPSPVPATAVVSGNEAPQTAPDLPADTQPVPPPDVSQSIGTAPVLQENANPPSGGATGALQLDPSVTQILFDAGSETLGGTVSASLDKIADALEAHPEARISLNSYAEKSGSNPREARRLSLARALAVRDYLTNKGISQSRIDVHAEGTAPSGAADRIDVTVNN